MLRVEDLSVAYDGIQALRGVSLEVGAGDIFALVGSNGAGKSTLLNTLSGLVKPSSGRILLEGKDITSLPAHARARAGLIQVPEGRRVVAPLTVAENLELGKQAAGARGPGAIERIHELFPTLKERAAQLSGTLSGGQQQMLAIGRALMGNPRVLLLDEPSLGLAPVVVQEVFRALVELNRGGLSILLVEQNARLALRTSRQAAVLERGRIVRTGASADLAADPTVVDLYLGRASGASTSSLQGVST
ncbi:ABC transporter ATP-binding protein [Ramlibacter sp.]|uniref:ABC transporter ATP-binding protein n=1 Tax=Ramlibacter sp. TaxID=1917967 RepID=UPI003D10CF27